MTELEAFKAMIDGKKVTSDKMKDDIFFFNDEGRFVHFNIKSDKEFPFFIKQDYKIVKEPILDKEEREYLKAVIRPFRKRIDYIVKKSVSNNEEYGYIVFGMRNEDNCWLPNFPNGSMYKGMELRKKYTLEELGL